MDITVINLMRLGDLVQTTPVLRRLRAHYPGARITLVAMDLFVETARLLPGVDRLVTFPSGVLAAALEPPDGWVKALPRLMEWRRDSLPPGGELAVNLTPNLLGGLLARLTGAASTRGLAVGADRRVFTMPAWTSYSLIVARARLANPFNLVDLFLKGAGLEPDGEGLEIAMPAAARQEAASYLAHLNLPPGAARVGLIPGASRPERQWPAERLGLAARLLLKERPCHFLIFGAAAERPLGEAVARQLPPGSATLVLGGTTPPQLAAFMGHLDLLVTNDTGPMHLAAAAGTRVLALFLASARVRDTGPAGPGHIMVEPGLDCHPCLTPCPQPRCRDLPTPEVVARLAAACLGGTDPAAAARGEGLGEVRLYRSSVDSLGHQAALPLTRRALTRRDFWPLVHRLAWPALLDRGAAGPRQRLAAWVGETLAGAFLPPAEDLGLPMGEAVFQEMAALARQGEDAAHRILRLARRPEAHPVRLRQQTERFQHLDPALHRLSLEMPEAGSFIDFFFQEQRASQAREVKAMARELARAYRFLARAGELARRTAADLAQTVGLSGPGPPTAGPRSGAGRTETTEHSQREVASCW